MARQSASSLAKQVSELRKLVDQHIARQHHRPVLRVIYVAGATDAEITALQAEACAAAGIDPAHADWLHRIIIKPAPLVEEPFEQTRGPRRNTALAEPRQPAFVRKPDATVVEDRPCKLNYPPAGLA
jgi:hypothetical protein